MFEVQHLYYCIVVHDGGLVTPAPPPYDPRFVIEKGHIWSTPHPLLGDKLYQDTSEEHTIYGNYLGVSILDRQQTISQQNYCAVHPAHVACRADGGCARGR